MVLMDITTPTLTLKHMIFPRFLAVIRPQLLELMEPNANFAGIVHIKRNRSLLNHKIMRTKMGLTDTFFGGIDSSTRQSRECLSFLYLLLFEGKGNELAPTR